MSTSNFYTYTTPVGRITLASNGSALIRLVFGEAALEGDHKPTSLTNTASTQVLQYLAGKRTVFDIPIQAEGSSFQKAVWEEVLRIPYGQTRSYKDIAAALGNANATRAVGMANNKNPLPIIIPCHRVIGANGKPVGYAGGLKIKEFLLNLEQSNSLP